MKLKSLLLLALLPAAYAVTLIWSPNDQSQQTQAYCVYGQTNVAVSFTKLATITNIVGTTNVPGWYSDGTTVYPTNTVVNIVATNVVLALPPGNYFFYVTSSNFWGESGPSNIAFTPAISTGTKNLSISK